MLIIYLSQETELIQWGNPPLVGDAFPGGGAIASVEIYQGDTATVYLALQEPLTHAPTESFNVQLAPDRSIIRYGWNMQGQPPTGRLKHYAPTSHPTLMRSSPSRWYVDQVETCKPVTSGTYTAIHLCHCVEAPVEVAA